MIPPVTVFATFVSRGKDSYTFNVRGHTYQIPFKEVWSARETQPGGFEEKLVEEKGVYPFEESRVYKIVVDGWWLDGANLYQIFRGITSFPES